MLRNGLPKSKESDPVESQFRLPYQFADSLQFVSVTNGGVSLFLYLRKGERAYKPPLSVHVTIPSAFQSQLHFLHNSEYPPYNLRKVQKKKSVHFPLVSVHRSLCESVMINFGGRARACRVAGNLSVVQVTTRHFLSNNSRIVCTCGKISLPFGA